MNTYNPHCWLWRRIWDVMILCALASVVLAWHGAWWAGLIAAVVMVPIVAALVYARGQCP